MSVLTLGSLSENVLRNKGKNQSKLKELSGNVKSCDQLKKHLWLNLGKNDKDPRGFSMLLLKLQ